MAATQIGKAPDRARTVLLTGFPRLLVCHLALRALEAHDHNRVALLVTKDDSAAASDFVQTLPAEQSERIDLLMGDLESPDLRLTGQETKRLIEDVNIIFHGDYSPHQGRNRVRKPVIRLHHVASLAGEMKQLERLCLFSSAFVSGHRTGLILEEELNMGQTMRTPFERSMMMCEELARELMPSLPTCVLRPSAMIGQLEPDGSGGLLEGPSYLLSLMLKLPSELPLMVPGRGVVPFNIVPVEYVSAASWHIAVSPRAMGRTFHLTDPNPVSARRAFELLAELSNRPKPLFVRWASILVGRTLRSGGLRVLSPFSQMLVDDLNRQVTYCCAGTLEILAGSSISCPPFDAYADTLLRWVSSVERRSSGHQGMGFTR